MKSKRPKFKRPQEPPVAFFRVHPQCKTLYFEVLVFRTWLEFHKHCVIKTFEERGVIDREASSGQCFNGPIYDSKGLVTPCLGQIVFYLSKATPDIVSHEMNHGAIYWAQRAGINITNDSRETLINGETQEETFVRAQQEMVKQFFKKMEKLALL